MGLCTTDVVNILQLAKKNGIKNKSLCMLGRQQIHIDIHEFVKVIEKYNFSYNKVILEEIKEKKEIDTYQFFHMFGFSEVDAIDISEHDKANIILDLSKDLPKNMHQKYDYVINGGTLEHIFDIANTMNNISCLVKEGGYIIHALPLGGYVDHGFYSFSPTFFIDYYKVNGFEIENIKMEFLLDKGKNPSQWKVYYSEDCRLFLDWMQINNYVKYIDRIDEVGRILLWCVARKKSDKDSYEFPTQGMYASIYNKYADTKNKTAIEKYNSYNVKNTIKYLQDNSDKKIVFYGAGKVCNTLINELYKLDMEDVISCIFDGNVEKSGSDYRGYRVLYPTKHKLKEYDIILICSNKYEDEIYSFLVEDIKVDTKVVKITELN